MALIGRYVTSFLKERTVGPCPFHNDRWVTKGRRGSASITFGCVLSGDAVQFLMAKDNSSLSDVLSDPGAARPEYFDKQRRTEVTAKSKSAQTLYQEEIGI